MNKFRGNRESTPEGGPQPKDPCTEPYGTSTASTASTARHLLNYSAVRLITIPHYTLTAVRELVLREDYSFFKQDTIDTLLHMSYIENKFISMQSREMERVMKMSSGILASMGLNSHQISSSSDYGQSNMSNATNRYDN